MKKLMMVLICGSLVLPSMLWAQTAVIPARPSKPHAGPVQVVGEEGEKSELTKFDLDFPGGSPKDLIIFIEKAMKKPVNAIITEESRSDQITLPPIKVQHVDISQIFDAILVASRRTARQTTGYQYTPTSKQAIYSEYIISYGFRPANAAVNDDTIWTFFNDKREPAPAVIEEDICSFFQLEDYLEYNNIDAITTALQTGFKLLGAKPPKLSYHPETKLLIAVGTQERLSLIERLLAQLPPRASSLSRPSKTANPPKAHEVKVPEPQTNGPVLK